MDLIAKLIKAAADYHCEQNGLQMVPQTVKIGEEKHTPTIYKKPSISGAIAQAAAKVYAEEHHLEIVGKA